MCTLNNFILELRHGALVWLEAWMAFSYIGKKYFLHAKLKLIQTTTSNMIFVDTSQSHDDMYAYL